MSTARFNINHQIKASEVRLLREDGTMIGVVALSEALSQSQAAGVDLVEIAPLAVPPVVKMIDYKKLLYQIAKKDREAKAGQKKTDLKEVRLTPFIAQNDFDTRMKRAREWLTTGNKVRVAIKFVGRQLGHREFGPKLIERSLLALGDIAAVDQEGKWVGRQFMATLTPVKKK